MTPKAVVATPSPNRKFSPKVRTLYGTIWRVALISLGGVFTVAWAGFLGYLFLCFAIRLL
jgi:hypothetical protein